MSADLVAELLQAQCVLCVQPHYDDNDLGAGGTLAALADRGAEVHYVTVTDGIVGVLDPQLTDDECLTRMQQEQREAGALVGVASQTNLDLPDAGDWDVVALRRDLIERIRSLRPDYVFTCDPWLPHEAHRDHLRTGIAVGEAVMFHTMPRFRTRPDVDDAYFRPSGRHELRALLLYFTTDANLVVDIGTTHERKHRAMDAYRSQLAPDALVALHRGIGAMEKRWAANEPFERGEALKLLRPGDLHVGIASPGRAAR